MLFFAKKFDKQDDEDEIDTMEELTAQVYGVKDEIENINTKINDLSKLVATETVRSDSQVANFVMKSLVELRDYVFKKDRRQSDLRSAGHSPKPHAGKDSHSLKKARNFSETHGQSKG